MKNARYIGKVVHHTEQATSTNDLAIEWLAKTTPVEGTLVTTDYQSAGRGQIGRSWHSAPGQNFTGSFILYPKRIEGKSSFLLSQLTALAVRDTVVNYLNNDVYIKWPNDIYVGHQKIAGLLLQLQWAGYQLRYAILGIGLNILQTDFPPELPNPTSLLACGADVTDRQLVIDRLCLNLETRYEQWRNGKAGHLRTAYQQALYGRGETFTFEKETGGTFSGQIIGVDEEGKLGIDTVAGRQWFTMHSLRWIIPTPNKGSIL